MRWSDEITLMHETQKTDSGGFAVPKKDGGVTLYANKKSVGFNEFFQAKQAGYTERLKFDVYTAEYSGQTLAEYEGKRYEVLRTYSDTKTPDFTELTLSDIRERGSG